MSTAPRDLVMFGLVMRFPPASRCATPPCAPIAFATVQHMLFDNARLEPGESVLVHAGGSGIGSVAIKMAKAIGCTVITTVGDDAKAEKAKALGADHVINYRTDRFEARCASSRARRGRRGIRARGGGDLQRLAPLPQARRPPGHLRRHLGTLDDHQPDAAFQQQYRIIGSFGASMRNIRESLARWRAACCR